MKSENSCCWFSPYTRIARNNDRTRTKTRAMKIETKYKRNSDTQSLRYTAKYRERERENEKIERDVCENYPHTNIQACTHTFTFSNLHKHTHTHTQIQDERWEERRDREMVSIQRLVNEMCAVNSWSIFRWFVYR